MPYPSQNRHRQPPRTKSGLRGVIFAPHVRARPWKVYLRHNGQYRTVGHYATKEEAGRVYNAWALKLKGEGTYLNPV